MKHLAHRLRKRLLPAPWLALALWCCWLMLAGSASLGQMLLGAVLALPLAALGAHLAEPRGEVAAVPLGARLATLARLAAIVARDIAVSNVDVARRVLGDESAIRSRWVELPLHIRDERGIAALASIITLTPGTLSAEVSADRRRLRVHALHVADDEGEAAMVADIRARYEQPLMALFGEAGATAEREAAT